MALWVKHGIAIAGALVALVILVRNLQVMITAGPREYLRDAFHIDPLTWWLLGAWLVVSLVIVAIWAFPCGGLLVAG